VAEPTVSGRPRVRDLEYIALLAEGTDQNQYPSDAHYAYVCGVRDALMWALGLKDRPPVLPPYLEGYLAQDIEEALEGR
jgi:hypothetical protein